MNPASVPWKERWTTLVRSVQSVASPAGAKDLLVKLVPAKTTTVLCFANAHAMNLAADQCEFYEALSSSDVLLRDGIGMAILFHRDGRDAGENMNGTDFIPKLLAACGREKQKVALWGSADPYLRLAGRNVAAQWNADVVSLEDGFAPDEHYVAALGRSQADVVILGMGMPKQERVALRLRASAARPTLIVCGGAIIDFLGGKVQRAPAWVRALRAEWLYRLCLEPRRLFKRYVVGNPVFLWRLLRWRSAAGR